MLISKAQDRSVSKEQSDPKKNPQNVSFQAPLSVPLARIRIKEK